VHGDRSDKRDVSHVHGNLDQSLRHQPCIDAVSGRHTAYRTERTGSRQRLGRQRRDRQRLGPGQLDRSCFERCSDHQLQGDLFARCEDLHLRNHFVHGVGPDQRHLVHIHGHSHRCRRSGFAISASAPVIPATVPTAPAGVTATLDTSNSNNYSWYSIGFTQGAGNGSPITQNSVTVTDLTNSHVLGPVAYAAGSPIEVAYANTADGTSTGAVVASRGDTLHFTVTVTNIVGTSTPSTAITAVLPVWTPLAPTGVSASAGDTAAAASWTASYNPPSAPAIASYIVTDGTGDTCTATAPASDGCSPVTGYTVVVVDQTTSTTTVVAGSSSFATVTGLTATDSYTFSVYATNVVGNSAASTPVQAVPRGPTSVTGTTLGDGTATISWTPSTVILGDAVTGFLVSSFDLTVLAAGPSVSVGSSTTTTTISGLTLGDQYDVCVSAQNSLSPLANETSSVCTA